MTPKEKHALLNQMGFIAEQMQELTEKLGNVALDHESVQCKLLVTKIQAIKRSVGKILSEREQVTRTKTPPYPNESLHEQG